jgi:hypothetical protein
MHGFLKETSPASNIYPAVDESARFVHELRSRIIESPASGSEIEHSPMANETW